MKSLLVTLFITYLLVPQGEAFASNASAKYTAITAPTTSTALSTFTATAASTSNLAQPGAHDETTLIVLSDRTAEYRVSATHVDLGIHLADLLDGANHYFNEVLEAAIPEVTVFIVSRDDWGIATNPQVIYGMPHYSQQRVVVAAEDNPFWQANLPRDEGLTEEQRQKLMSVYGTTRANSAPGPFLMYS
jgi:hypothetical protein